MRALFRRCELAVIAVWYNLAWKDQISSVDVMVCLACSTLLNGFGHSLVQENKVVIFILFRLSNNFLNFLPQISNKAILLSMLFFL